MKELSTYEVPKVHSNPLDDVNIGDWYWVLGTTDDKEPVETLFCVDEIGSNFVGFGISSQHGTRGCRVHFNEFFSRCRPEPNWKAVLQTRMDSLQKQIQEKTAKLVQHGQKLFLLPKTDSTSAPTTTSLLPTKVADAPKKYKADLVKLQEKIMPAIAKEIDVLAKEYAVTAKNMALPDLVKLQVVKQKLGVVEDRIFTIELYCGLQEDVVQIAKGNPAPAEEKITIRQALLYMDEETLFHYTSGGMDFNDIKKFDEWVVKPENLTRVLPEQKGVVAFRVRRHDKDYGMPSDLLGAWARISWAEANKQTYLLIRNGENVYRIASELDFSPRLIPMKNEIGEEQFKKINERYEWQDHGPSKRIEEIEMVTPASIEFDDHVKKVDKLLKQYNRIVILIQGLLDRSMIFHPHPPINLVMPGVLDEWVRLVRDEEMGLPSNKVTFAGYRDQLNKTLKVGKCVYIRLPEIHSRKYAGPYYYDEETGKKVDLPRRSWVSNPLPKVCKVVGIKRDRSAVYVSWPQGKCSEYHYDKDGKWTNKTDRLCHQWIPFKYCLNITDYHLGEYKMFLCDRALKGQYLEWAPFLLTAEDWARERAKGISEEVLVSKFVREW